MIAVPEYTKIVIGIPYAVYLNEMEISMHYQHMMRVEIAITLGIETPRTNEPFQSFAHFKLKALADLRRSQVIPALENIIRHVLAGILRTSLSQMCRLLAVYMSARFPTSYIKSLRVDDIDNTCTLWNGSKNMKYRKNGHIWGQISLSNIHITIQPLKELLLKPFGP
ncbi:uncharacterized protein LOC126840717 [Adelges cooleyi]|uniref:uncharacterized protein LOC126840717 n=1 Tax=Adelges cooleyi TaxID=133065 RepID=UPI00218098FA|nr:uncharacterized protein LOC126840717 [Adelges cooleyi]